MLDREKGREGERSINMTQSATSRIHPDHKSNRQLFGAQDDTQPMSHMGQYCLEFTY